MSPCKSLSIILLVALCGCSAPRPTVSDWTPPPPAVAAQPSLQSLGYSIQVGAFANPGNATRLAALLESRGIEAYSFLHESGLYKVRFGDHATYAAAHREAESLQQQGMIDSFFIVPPEDNAAEKIRRSGQGDLRQELVATAHRFIGTPYNWGGTSDDGIDCSGLTMVTYRLNGLKLPRVSRDQFAAGRAVNKGELKKGDLVFFATGGGSRVSHVGLYIGNGRFIHAPSRGKSVRVTSLDHSYYQKTFVGARTYL
ncbi:C40 family peptidase [Trichloromonas sp.]|uniref:C40 family peptidase n=1 Tax=Trichloromonas sp. TaxID=3069249 RepID=UPI003D815D7B